LSRHGFATQLDDLLTAGRRRNRLIWHDFKRFNRLSFPPSPRFRLFVRCEKPAKGLSSRPDGWGRRGLSRVAYGIEMELKNRKNMDESVQKSCWGVTAKAVIGFAGIMMLAWLFGGPEVAMVVAGG